MLKIFKNTFNENHTVIHSDNVIICYDLSVLYDKDFQPIKDLYYHPVKNKIIKFVKNDFDSIDIQYQELFPLLDHNGKSIYLNQHYQILSKKMFFETFSIEHNNFIIDDVKNYIDVTDKYFTSIQEVYNRIQIKKISSALTYEENESWTTWSYKLDDNGLEISGKCLNPDELYAQEKPQLTSNLYDVKISEQEKSYWMVTVRYKKRDGKITFETIGIISNHSYEYSINDVFEKIKTNQVSIIYDRKFRNLKDYSLKFGKVN